MKLSFCLPLCLLLIFSCASEPLSQPDDVSANRPTNQSSKHDAAETTADQKKASSSVRDWLEANPESALLVAHDGRYWVGDTASDRMRGAEFEPLIDEGVMGLLQSPEMAGRSRCAIHVEPETMYADFTRLLYTCGKWIDTDIVAEMRPVNRKDKRLLRRVDHSLDVVNVQAASVRAAKLNVVLVIDTDGVDVLLSYGAEIFSNADALAVAEGCPGEGHSLCWEQLEDLSKIVNRVVRLDLDWNLWGVGSPDAPMIRVFETLGAARVQRPITFSILIGAIDVDLWVAKEERQDISSLLDASRVAERLKSVEPGDTSGPD